MVATQEKLDITDFILRQMSKGVFEEKLTTTEAADQVFKLLNEGDKLDFVEIYGRTSMVQYFNTYRGGLRRDYLDKGVITKPSNTNSSRITRHVASPYDISYIGSDGLPKRLGDFTLKDVMFQVGFYDTRVIAYSTELDRLRRLSEDMSNRVKGKVEDTVVRSVYSDEVMQIGGRGR